MLDPDREESLQRIIKLSAIIWVGCITGVLLTLGYIYGIRKEAFDKAPVIYSFILLFITILGCFSFFTGSVSFIALILIKKSQRRPNNIVFVVKLLFILAVLPLYLLLYFLRPLEVVRRIERMGIIGFWGSISAISVLKRLVILIFITFMILPMWIGGYVLAGIGGIEVLGYRPELIAVSGTGSMYPTFPKGQGKDNKAQVKEIVGTPGMIRYPNGLVIGGKRFFGYQIGRGDIVVIENDKIREMTRKMYGDSSGWVKRIVGISGDSIEIREGIVYLNGKQLKEPYIAKPRSTFGETFLGECKKVIVPENYIFVMGDNRKGSGDSREVGFIEIDAINHVLPLENQKGILDKFWRDTTKDFDEGSKIKLDKDKYLKLLNDRRKEAGAGEIKYQPKLEKSASSRGEIILEFDDFSFEATRSGYTVKQAMRDANYSNIVWGEVPSQGYYEAEELIDNQFQFSESKKFLLDKTFQEVGIGEVEGKINGCPAQVVVQHFAGYVPPNYKKEDIDSWRTGLSRLREVQPGWAELKERSEFYQKNKVDVDRINEIISIRIANFSAIVARMEANQWLTQAEEKMIDLDKNLSDEQDGIATRLNSQE